MERHVTMKASKFYGAWTGASSVAALLLSISSREVAARANVPDVITGTVLCLAILTAIASLIALALAAVARLGEKRVLRASMAELQRLARRVEYLPRAARPEDIEPFREYAKRYFGPGVTPLPRQFTWHARNPDVFHVISPLGRTGIVGGFTIIPLTKRAREQLEAGMVDGVTFLPEHIAATTARAAGFYIGSIIGDSAYIRALALQAVRFHLMHVAAGKRVYARPVTQDGSRACRQWGFSPLSSELSPGTLEAMHFLDVERATDGRRAQVRTSAGSAA
jgi:hypothetical protein